MARGLATYRKKRDFSKTREPSGREQASKTKKVARRAPIFVVQEHHARRLHYDFRLELDGTLKSWAVPKGPSNDPRDKRLAVQVEDHPIDYAAFEGDIPEGEYGAGHVEIWDRGTWSPVGDPREGLASGKLEFTLAGEKLGGRFKLVRMADKGRSKRQPEWLLIKAKDEHASSVPVVVSTPEVELPQTLAPMLATWLAAPPTSDDYHYEIKLDGYRLLARLDGSDVSLRTRNGIDYTAKLPEHVAALAALRARGSFLDGEIVVFDDAGVSRFGALQDALAKGRSQDVRYAIFDLPFHEGRDIRELPIEARRERLGKLLAKNRSSLLVPCSWVDGDPRALLEAARASSYEGLIGKRVGSPYFSGRARSWIKLTFAHRQECVVVGYSAPKGTRAGLGALLLAVREGGALRYVGRVGTGFSARALDALATKLEALRTERMPLPKRPEDARGVRWVEPRLVVDVEHAGFTDAGLLRKGTFLGVRPDRDAKEAVRREPEAPTGTKGDARGDVVEGVRISNGDRIIDTKSGATKLDLARFYAAIAPHVRPHLAHRPVALLRAPDGVGHGTFFQKHAAPRVIPGVRLMDPSLDPDHPPLLAIDDATALVGAVQMGTIELHTWNAVERRIEQPDRVTFDLDPDPALPFARVRQAASLVRELLGELGLPAFVKTTGGAGLHVVVPLTPHDGWDDVKAFSRAVAEHAARTLPKIFVAKSGAKNRVGRIFVDYLRNGRGSSTVSAFSVRARPGLPVSVPVSWAELDTIDDPAALHIGSVVEWLAARGDDPWADYASARRRITKAMYARLGLTPPGSPRAATAARSGAQKRATKKAPATQKGRAAKKPPRER